ncbi:MAG: HAMP domain-containing sensor histidine kinase [bacterium]
MPYSEDPQQHIRELEAEISKLKVDLNERPPRREVEELKHVFVATASHQLRTPLSTIKWLLAMLQSDPEILELPAKLKMVNQAYQTLERAIDTVNDLVNLARIEDGKLPVTYQEASLTDIIKKATEWTKTVAESRGLGVISHVSETLPVFSFDPLLIAEVIENMVNNALDYSLTGNDITLRAWSDAEQVYVSVTDVGIGVQPDDHSNIFMPFYRAENARNAHPDGSGLGLYLSKYIALEHNGNLTFESSPSGVTTFTLRLPLVHKETKPGGETSFSLNGM